MDEFDGIFSIVFYDKNNDKVVIIRDHLGVKPLYYSIQNNKLYISSEIKPIAKYIKAELTLMLTLHSFLLVYQRRSQLSSAVLIKSYPVKL